MEYFTNQWGILEDTAKKGIIICGLIMGLMFYVMVKMLAEYDKFKYRSNEDDDDSQDDVEY